VLPAVTLHLEPADSVLATHRGLDHQKYVVVDPQFYRPAEVQLLVANSAKARNALGWISSIGCPELVRQMVEQDCEAVGLGSALRAAAR
jgi:GDPmannose 4,6-dehydratase